jgi:hypothetical protein
LPDIEDILTSDEKDLLEKQPDLSTPLCPMDAIMHQTAEVAHRPGVDVNRVMEEPKITKFKEAPATNWKVISGISLCSLLLLVGYYYRHSLKTSGGRWVPGQAAGNRSRGNGQVYTPPQIPVLIPRLHFLGIEEVDSRERSFTPFAKRGRMPMATTAPY